MAERRHRTGKHRCPHYTHPGRANTFLFLFLAAGSLAARLVGQWRVGALPVPDDWDREAGTGSGYLSEGSPSTKCCKADEKLR